MDNKNKRISMSISLIQKERDELMEFPKSKGLNFSAFLRFAAFEYIKNEEGKDE